VETAVTKKRNELSWLYSREAFRLTAANLDHVFRQPDDLEARAAMQLGAAYAGTAIENSMLGAAHSAANPLTARFGVIHGQAVGIMLPHVVRFNAQRPDAAAIYAELAKFAGLAAWMDRTEQALEALIARIKSLLQAGQMPPSLSALNIPLSRLPDLAEEAAGQWTAQFNPRPITASDFEAIYAAAL
jgi:alcohol dehydrogenase